MARPNKRFSAAPAECPVVLPLIVRRMLSISSLGKYTRNIPRFQSLSGNKPVHNPVLRPTLQALHRRNESDSPYAESKKLDLLRSLRRKRGARTRPQNSPLESYRSAKREAAQSTFTIRRSWCQSSACGVGYAEAGAVSEFRQARGWLVKRGRAKQQFCSERRDETGGGGKSLIGSVQDQDMRRKKEKIREVYASVKALRRAVKTERRSVMVRVPCPQLYGDTTRFTEGACGYYYD